MICEVTLEKDRDLSVEHSLGMGLSSIISNTAPADGLFQNAVCKYYEVDQTLFEEKVTPRGKELGRHLLSSESQRPED